MGQSKNYDPELNVTLEVYTEFGGEPETLTFAGLSFKEAAFFQDKMEPDTDYQMFRVWSDGSRTKIKIP